MFILINEHKCDSFNATMYLFLNPYDFFCRIEKNIHLPVLSIVGKFHEHSEVGQMIANTFRMVIRDHLRLTSFTWPTPKAL